MKVKNLARRCMPAMEDWCALLPHLGDTLKKKKTLKILKYSFKIWLKYSSSQLGLKCT